MLGQIRKSQSWQAINGSYFLDVQTLEYSVGKIVDLQYHRHNATIRHNLRQSRH